MTSDKQSPQVSLDIDIHDVFAQIRLNNDAFLITEAFEDILIARLAQQAGITALDSEVDAEIDAFRVRLGLYKAEDLAAWLSERGLDAADLSEKFRQMVRKEKLARQVTEPVLADHYLQHRAEYDLFNLSQIVVAQVADAHEIVRQLTRDGRDFAEVARQHSLDTETAELGGLLGRCKRRDLPAHFAAELAGTSPGRLHVFGPFEISGRFVIHQASLERESQLDLPLRIEIRRALFADWLAAQKEAAGLPGKIASLLQHRRARAEEKPAATPEPRLSRRDLAAGIVATALSADFVARDQARYAFDRTNAPQSSGPAEDSHWAPAGAWRHTAQKQSSPPPPPPPPPPRSRPRNPPAVAGVRG